MSSTDLPLSLREQTTLELRSLFGRYGYSRCRVSTFEQYDFYARNRSALSMSEVLIFTDADGRLMALKPDVTMSIVKNIPDRVTGLQKLCYNENVYRIPAIGAGFRESVQTGLECIGDLDAAAVGEVILLAAKSLETIRPNYILEVSHVGIVDGLLEQAGVQDPAPILKAMEQKNTCALQELCREMPPACARTLETLCSLYGPMEATLPQVKAMALGSRMLEACRELEQLLPMLQCAGLADRVYLDFSIRGGTDYYSGILLRGSVDGAASPVLWGGQYDTLLQKMGKNAKGIGFAVYLDQLEQARSREPDTDALLIYDEASTPSQVLQGAEALRSQGLRVRAERRIPEGFRYQDIYTMTAGEVKKGE